MNETAETAAQVSDQLYQAVLNRIRRELQRHAWRPGPP